MSTKPTTLPHTVRHFSGGGCAAFLVGLFVAPVAAGLAQTLLDYTGLPKASVVGPTAAVALAVLSYVYYFFSQEYVARIDPLGLTITAQSRLGPIRGRTDTVLDARWDSVEFVYDVARTNVTERGDTNTSYQLVVGDQVFHGALLGTVNRDGRYLELLEAIRLAIGERLVAKDDLGGLEGAVRRLVDQQVEERLKQPRSGGTGGP